MERLEFDDENLIGISCSTFEKCHDLYNVWMNDNWILIIMHNHTVR